MTFYRKLKSGDEVAEKIILWLFLYKQWCQQRGALAYFYGPLPPSSPDPDRTESGIRVILNCIESQAFKVPILLQNPVSAAAIVTYLKDNMLDGKDVQTCLKDSLRDLTLDITVVCRI